MKYINKSPIQVGMSFQEGTSGTNAISLAMDTGKPVYVLPHYHYCSFLRNWYSYCTCIRQSSKVRGYLSFLSRENPIRNEIMLITELAGYQIGNELKDDMREISHMHNNIKLSDRQTTLLKLMARGYTDRAIAIEMDLNIGTISYHKTNIFKILGAECSIQAVVKALKLNLLSMDQIEI